MNAANLVSDPGMYLIMDFGTKEKPTSPTGLRTVYSRQIWEEVDKAKQEGLLIAVYKLEDCLLDWS